MKDLMTEMKSNESTISWIKPEVNKLEGNNLHEYYN